MFNLFTQLLVLLPFFIFPIADGTSDPTLPIVDLGYELHQAFSFNPETGLYNFSNIRYAEPPVGELRFRASVPPRNRRKIVDQGTIGKICPQAMPAWLDVAGGLVTGKISNVSAFDSARAGPLPPQDPREMEDCLFLDIIVPQKVFEQAAPHRRPLAPVLVWIYGGGHTFGEKSDAAYNSTGLIKTSQSSNSTGLIYVAINYRLGAFGWLSGPDLQADGTANAGLYDQQLALRWVQKYIKFFGGDANKVTVIGESAGGSSIIHQLTAFGGLHGPVPFQQAIIQSPGLPEVASSFKQQETFNTFLSLLKVNTIGEARKLPASSLINANRLQIFQSDYGDFRYGVVLDGRFVPAPVGRLLHQGWFDKNVKLMVAHNKNEGLFFTDPSIRNESAFIETFRRQFPTISPNSTEYIAHVLYPQVFDGSYVYTDQSTREALLLSDEFTCNTDYLNRAYGGKTYAYRFSVPPAIHAQDVAYTFYNGPNTPDPLGLGIPDQPIAEALQKYIVSFTATGVPSGQNLPVFPQWGKDKNLLDLNVTGISVVKDDTVNSRCDWWQKALYY
ncbi:hypothetical protein MMC31_003041 [Peltigera leucophlebia]|nr:hypothetical protein [Peltigera leucophlebia]